MKIHLVLFLIVQSIFTHSQTFAQDKILIVTGGHDFERKSFFEMFDSFADIDYDTIVQPAGNIMVQNDGMTKYYAIVFYDMYQDITESQKSAYIKLLSAGKGMVFLHHSLVSYQDWPEFQEIIGGKYLLNFNGDQPKSTFMHDVDIDVEIVDQNHLITYGMKNFRIHDEVYGSYIVNESVSPILKTTHPESSNIIGWHHQYKKSRIVYLQSGHDHYAFENENFRNLLQNAIKWVKFSETN